MSADPPAIRWVRDGEHAGFYVYVPTWRKWRRFGLNGAGMPLNLEPVADLPAGSEALHDCHSVGAAIDGYRDTLHDLTELRVPNELHTRLREAVMMELADVDDYPVVCAEMRYEAGLRDV